MDAEHCPKCGGERLRDDGDWGWNRENWRKGALYVRCECPDCGSKFILDYRLAAIAGDGFLRGV